ncbi:MAG: hypothetical protein ACRETH_06295 [Steroidobacteraceae bacterium]
MRRELSCPACGLSFLAEPGRRIWCSDACRQLGYRRRHRPPVDTVIVFPITLPRSAFVYECSECEARFVGVQRCEACNVFCRKVGPGGPCPHCDEAVAVTDLIPGASVR